MLSGLSGLDRLGGLTINIPGLEEAIKAASTASSSSNAEEVSEEPLKGSYSSDDRQGSFSTKVATKSGGVDTSAYDAQLSDIQSRMKELEKQQKYGFGWTPSEYDTSAYKEWKQLSDQQMNLILNRANLIKPTDTNRELDSKTTQADKALQNAQSSSQAEAVANKTANINAGINKSRAGMLGSQTASSSGSAENTANAVYSGNQASQAATQGDYLQKMGQAKALEQQAQNISNSAGLAGVSGFLGGASSGASLGASLSDENAKVPPDGIDEDELVKSIKQFKELYNELKQLKGEA